MAHFGAASEGRLATCHPDLQRVLREAVRYIDFTVECGHRGEVDQNAAVAAGDSKTPWPTSKHNHEPSLAVDVAPFPVDYAETEKARQRFLYLAGFIMCTARRLGVNLRYGGDWDSDDDMRDEPPFRDLPHFELR